MSVQCPICAGAGVAPAHNGVDPQRGNELMTCFMCQGIGEVIEIPTEKITIKKYWNIIENGV